MGCILRQPRCLGSTLRLYAWECAQGTPICHAFLPRHVIGGDYSSQQLFLNFFCIVWAKVLPILCDVYFHFWWVESKGQSFLPNDKVMANRQIRAKLDR